MVSRPFSGVWFNVCVLTLFQIGLNAFAPFFPALGFLMFCFLHLHPPFFFFLKCVFQKHAAIQGQAGNRIQAFFFFFSFFFFLFFTPPLKNTACQEGYFIEASTVFFEPTLSSVVLIVFSVFEEK